MKKEKIHVEVVFLPLLNIFTYVFVSVKNFYKLMFAGYKSSSLQLHQITLVEHVIAVMECLISPTKIIVFQ